MILIKSTTATANVLGVTLPDTVENLTATSSKSATDSELDLP